MYISLKKCKEWVTFSAPLTVTRRVLTNVCYRWWSCDTSYWSCISDQSCRSHRNDCTRTKAIHAWAIMSQLPSGSQKNVRDNNDKNVESVSRNITGGMTKGNEPEGRVLVLYTGGTIGMMRNDQGGNYFVKLKERLSCRFPRMWNLAPWNPKLSF